MMQTDVIGSIFQHMQGNFKLCITVIDRLTVQVTDTCLLVCQVGDRLAQSFKLSLYKISKRLLLLQAAFFIYSMVSPSFQAKISAYIEVASLTVSVIVHFQRCRYI